MMFKRNTSLFIALCLLMVLAVPRAAASSAVPVTVDDALVDGSYLAGDVTMTPLRALCGVLGGWTVSWHNRYASAQKGGVTLRVFPDSGSMTVNGTAWKLSGLVKLSGGRVFVPLRSVCQALGYSVFWDDALGGAAVSPGKAQSYTDEDLYWLSRIISAESQGEPLKGQIAVGNVVLNRVSSVEFPNTVKGVVFDAKDGTQFEPVTNKTVYNEPTPRSVAAAKAALAGTRVVGKCLYFYAPALSKGTWIRTHRTYYATIGCHRFYL